MICVRRTFVGFCTYMYHFSFLYGKGVWKYEDYGECGKIRNVWGFLRNLIKSLSDSIQNEREKKR